MASEVMQPEQLLSLWTADALREGHATTKDKTGDGDQDDAMVKSMLSFDTDSDEESNSDQTPLHSEKSVKQLDSTYAPFVEACQVLAAGLSQSLTDTSSMMSDATLLSCQSQLDQARSSQEASVSDFCDLGSIFSSTCSAQDCKDSSEPPCKKQKAEWSDSLHECFLAAVHRLGADKAVPSKILEAMGPAAAGMTLQDIAGHLQCYRQASSQLAAPTSAPAPSPAPAPQPPVAYVHAAAAPWMFTSMPAGDPAFPGAAPTPLGMPQLPPGPAALPVGVFGVPAGGISGISGVPASPAGGNGMSLVANLIPGQFPFFAGLPPQVLSASGFASAPGLPLAGNVPGMPYAMPMQMPTGQCWGPPTYNMQPGPMQYMAHMPNPAQQHRQQARSQVQPQLPAPAQPVLPAQQQVQQHQQQQRCCARVMPMIPTPGSANHSQSLQGTSPEAIQMAVADILDRSCQAVPPIGLKLDVPGLAKQWNDGNGQIKTVQT